MLSSLLRFYFYLETTVSSRVLPRVGVSIVRCSPLLLRLFLFVGACACDYQVGSTGSLTAVGDAAIRTNDNADNTNEGWVLRNAGVLSFPRGVSLTIAGGIEQTPTGVALVNLPPPLYLPFPGVSYEDQPASEGGGHLGQHPLVMESGATRLGGTVNASAWKGGGESERWAVRYSWRGDRRCFFMRLVVTSLGRGVVSVSLSGRRTASVLCADSGLPESA